jgi:hypothetical protein
MSIISEHERTMRRRGRPLSAAQCALVLVTSGLAVAAVMLALIASVQPAQAGHLTTVPEEAYGEGSVFAEFEPSQGLQPNGSVFARSPLQEATYREGSVFAQLDPQAGPYRQSSIFAQFYPQPEPTFTPFPPPPELTIASMPLGPFMPMPAEGDWVVTCGYRCGLHTAANNMTFALDIVPVQGQAAGQSIRSPVDGQISVVVDASTFFCQGVWRYGPEGGSVIVIDFQDDDNAPWRLRLVHLEPDTVGDHLRPTDEPVPVAAGTYLGNLAPLDGCGHLHMSLTRLEEGREIPKPMTIEGALLEDCGGDGCWEGTELPLERP